MATTTERRSLRQEMGILSEGDLADLLDITKETLQVWRSEGKGPPFTRLGKSIFYRIQDFQNWVAGNVALSTKAA